jgi:hypothetical protein
MKTFVIAVLLFCPSMLIAQAPPSDQMERSRCVEKAKSSNVPRDLLGNFEKEMGWIREQDISAMITVRSCLQTLQPPRSKEEQDALVHLQDFVLRAFDTTRKAALVLDEIRRNVNQGSVEKTLTNTIEFSRVTLALGMPQDSALAKLNEQYTTKNTGDDTWEVSLPKDGTALGEIDFKNRKLTRAERNWLIQPLTAVGFAESFYDVTSSFQEEGRIHCTIGTFNHHDPGSETKSASISCGHKSIDILIIDVGKDHILGLSERLQ